MIACSVCHAIIEPGATNCPGCGLALVAQAIPVVHRPAPIWPYILGAIILFVLLANIADRWQRDKSAAAQASLRSDLKSGALSTPAAFQARCGSARWTKQAKDGTELQYRIAGNDYFVTFAAAGPRFESEHLIQEGSKLTTYRLNLDPVDTMQRLGCK